MRIPKSLKIGPFRYRVNIAPGLMLDGIEVQGFTEFINPTIHLSSLITGVIPSPEVTAETLLHEIFEAINMDCGLELDHRVLSTLSLQLFSVMRENKLDFSS